MNRIKRLDVFCQDRYDSLLDYDMLAEACANILADKLSDDLDGLFRLGGSSGGVMLIVMTEINGEAWLIRFLSFYDKNFTLKNFVL